MQVRVLIVGNFFFPFGSASAERVRNLALGFAECGAVVHVLPMLRQPGKQVIDRVEALEGSVTYEYSVDEIGWRRWVLPGKLRWFYSLYAGCFRASGKLASRLREEEYTLVYCYGSSGFVMRQILKQVVLARVVSLLDMNEIRAQFRGRGGWLSPLLWDWWFLEKIVAKRFSGVVGISSDMAEYAEGLGVTSSMVVPSTIEMKALPKADVAKFKQGAVAELVYVGTLVPRDAPEQILSLVERAACEGWPVRVSLIGRFDSYREGRKILDSIRGSEELMRIVNIVGEVSAVRLRECLASADAFIHTRRDLQTERCSFPTRLVEFLGYGKPVFVSAVGDIPKYLRGDVDVVYLDPGRVSALGNAVEGFIQRREQHCEIGRSGHETASAQFSRSKHAKRILGFAGQLTP